MKAIELLSHVDRVSKKQGLKFNEITQIKCNFKTSFCTSVCVFLT